MSAQKRAHVASMRQQFRRDGYDDGLKGKPARYTLAEYQTAYRRGAEARRRGQEGDAA